MASRLRGRVTPRLSKDGRYIVSHSPKPSNPEAEEWLNSVTAFSKGSHNMFEDKLTPDAIVAEKYKLTKKGQAVVVSAIAFLSEQAYNTAKEKGFHSRVIPEDLKDLLVSQRLGLIHSEVSEVLEAIRKGNPESQKIPGFSQVEEEMADVVIRCLDFAHAEKLRLGQAILAKMSYNESRPHMHGGKAF